MKKLLSHKFALLCILIGVAILVATGIYATRYYHNPSHNIPLRASRNISAIQEWMTIRYVSRIYALPEQILLDAVGITQQQAMHQSIRSIALSQHKKPQQVLDAIRTAVLQYQENN